MAKSKKRYDYALKTIRAALANHNEECIIWPYFLDRLGHGLVWVSKTATCKSLPRIALAERLGHELPRHLVTTHTCAEKACYNPYHLKAVFKTDIYAKSVAERITFPYHDRTGKNRPRSGYRGVYPHREQYQAVVYVNHQRIYLGLFNDPAEAAKIRDFAAVAIYGPDAYTNFPRENYDRALKLRQTLLNTGATNGYANSE